MESRIPHVYISDEQREYFKSTYPVTPYEKLKPEQKSIVAMSKVTDHLIKSAAPVEVLEAADYVAEQLNVPYVIISVPEEDH